MKGRLFVTPKSQNEILNTSRTKTEFLLKEDMILSKVSNTTYFNSNNINLVRNSEYLDEMNRWQKNVFTTHDPTVKLETSNSVKYNATGVSVDSWTPLRSEFVDVSAGYTYTASVYTYTNDITTINKTASLELEYYNGTDSVTRMGAVGTILDVENGKWKRSFITLNVPTGASRVRMRIHAVQNGRFWISRPMLEKGDVASAWRPHVDDMVVQKGTQRDIPIRYIRDWLNGSTANAGSHWVEIQAIKDGVNVALNKPVTGNVPENPTYPYSRITDGTISSEWAGASIEDGNPRCVTVDLGSVVNGIEHLQIYHYYSDGRSYKQTKTEVSADGINWTTLFDSAVSGMYQESSAGKKIYVNTHESLRKAESSITQTANKISLVVSETDAIKGDALVSAINIQPGTVRISAKNINIDGAVKFSSFDSSVRSSLVDSAAPENIFPNGKFEDWEGALPNGWTRWTGSGSLYKSSAGLTHGFSPRFTVTNTQEDGFSFILNGKPENQYYIAEFGFMIESGNGVGAGILLRHHNAINGGGSYREVKVQISDYIPNPVVGQWYTIRTFVEIPKYGGTTSYSGYVMANWNGFNGGVRSAKTINFDKVLWRPATENEIQTNNKWVAKKYAIGAQASASYEPTFEMLSRFSVAESKMVNDAASFTNVFTGDYYAIHYATAVFVPQDKNVTFPSVIADDSVAIYVNGNKVGFKAGATASSMVLPLKTGWNNIDVLVYEHAGAESVGFGTKLSDFVLLMQPSQNPASYNSAISDGLARVITDMSAIEENVTKINGGRILTNSITAKQIAANTIKAENLFIGDMTNMMQYEENSYVGGYGVVTNTDNQKYFKIGQQAYSNLQMARSERVEFKVGDSYFLGFNGFKESAITGAINFIIRYYYTDGSATNAGIATIPFTTTVTSLEAILKITTAPTVGKTISYVMFFVEKDNTTSGYFHMRNVELRKMYSGKMIVDGTIDANKVTIASSTAGVSIDSNGVTASNASTGVSVKMNSSTGFEIKKGADTVFTVNSDGSLTAKNIKVDGGVIQGSGLQSILPADSEGYSKYVSVEQTKIRVGKQKIVANPSYRHFVGTTIDENTWYSNNFLYDGYSTSTSASTLGQNYLKLESGYSYPGGSYDSMIVVDAGGADSMNNQLWSKVETYNNSMKVQSQFFLDITSVNKNVNINALNGTIGENMMYGNITKRALPSVAGQNEVQMDLSPSDGNSLVESTGMRLFSRVNGMGLYAMGSKNDYTFLKFTPARGTSKNLTELLGESISFYSNNSFTTDVKNLIDVRVRDAGNTLRSAITIDGTKESYGVWIDIGGGSRTVIYAGESNVNPATHLNMSNDSEVLILEANDSIQMYWSTDNLTRSTSKADFDNTIVGMIGLGGAFRPTVTEKLHLGSTSYRFNTVWAKTTSINSDSRSKHDIQRVRGSKWSEEGFTKRLAKDALPENRSAEIYEFMKSMPLYQFKYDDMEQHANQFGFIADQLVENDKNKVADWFIDVPEKEEDRLSVSTQSYAAAIHIALQEEMERNDALEKKVEDLEERLLRLEQLLGGQS